MINRKFFGSFIIFFFFNFLGFYKKLFFLSLCLLLKKAAINLPEKGGSIGSSIASFWDAEPASGLWGIGLTLLAQGLLSKANPHFLWCSHSLLGSYESMVFVSNPQINSFRTKRYAPIAPGPHTSHRTSGGVLTGLFGNKKNPIRMLVQQSPPAAASTTREYFSLDADASEERDTSDKCETHARTHVKTSSHQ